MNVKPLTVTGTTNIKVMVDPKDVIKELIKEAGFEERYDSSVIIKDGKLFRENDISRHGSPTYEYVEISSDPREVEAFQALNVILKWVERKNREGQLR